MPPRLTNKSCIAQKCHEFTSRQLLKHKCHQLLRISRYILVFYSQLHHFSNDVVYESTWEASVKVSFVWKIE